MYNFEKLATLSNKELQNLLIECRDAYNAIKPRSTKKSGYLTELINNSSGIAYMDQFSNAYSDIKAEVIRRFYIRKIN